MALDLIQQAALEALSLLLPAFQREELIRAITEEKPYPQYQCEKIAQWKTTGHSSEDEEWWEESHYIEISYTSRGGLVLQSYWNIATMIGAGQREQYRVSSKNPFDADAEAELRRWSALWHAFCAAGSEHGVHGYYAPTIPIKEKR